MRAAFALLCLAAAACVGPEDDPTKVIDLRVLGASFEPPELMAPFCVLDSPPALAVFAAPVRYTALIVDPAGGGRSLDYELLACTKQGDRTCENQADRVVVSSGVTTAGELALTFQPGRLSLADGTSLVARVLEQDTYKGLGGVRLPLVLHLRAGEEEVYAQKLMLFSCRFFPEQSANLTPVLPGLTLDARPWTEEPLGLEGAGPFTVRVDDFSSLQEAYVVPSYELAPVNLVESWKISWHATSGRLSPGQTGGADFGGEEGRHIVEWNPGTSSVETDVSFWMVVRDGRGGTSWLLRSAHHRP